MYDIKINLVVKNPVSIISIFYFLSIIYRNKVFAPIFLPLVYFFKNYIWIFVLLGSFPVFGNLQQPRAINQIKFKLFTIYSFSPWQFFFLFWGEGMKDVFFSYFLFIRKVQMCGGISNAPGPNKVLSQSHMQFKKKTF